MTFSFVGNLRNSRHSFVVNRSGFISLVGVVDNPMHVYIPLSEHSMDISIVPISISCWPPRMAGLCPSPPSSQPLKQSRERADCLANALFALARSARWQDQCPRVQVGPDRKNLKCEYLVREMWLHHPAEREADDENSVAAVPVAPTLIEHSPHRARRLCKAVRYNWSSLHTFGRRALVVVECVLSAVHDEPLGDWLPLSAPHLWP